MVVDASAILAIAFQEDDVAAIEFALAEAGGGLISTVNYWECLVGVRRRFADEGVELVEATLARMNIRPVDANPDLARSAADAFARNKGRAGGRLNLGDCFAYALAQREDDGLLFKGNNFPETDVKSVL